MTHELRTITDTSIAQYFNQDLDVFHELNTLKVESCVSQTNAGVRLNIFGDFGEDQDNCYRCTIVFIMAGLMFCAILQEIKESSKFGNYGPP